MAGRLPAAVRTAASALILAWVLTAPTSLSAANLPEEPAGDSAPGATEEMTGSSLPPALLESNPFIIGPPDSIHIGLPPVLGSADGVKDPLFAILIGLVSDGLYGTLTGDRIRGELKRQKARSNLPHQTVREVTRLPVTPGRTAVVRVEFEKDLRLPIPFSILGYRPGSFSVSSVSLFREWILDTVTLEFQDDPRDPDSIWQVELTDVHILGLVDGEVEIDIHGWLDFLMGSRLGDTRITGLMLCRHHGRWIGIAMGYSPDNQGRSGIFDFEKDSIFFPSPAELRPVGRRMRSRMEALMARWEYDNMPRAVSGGKMRLIEGLVHEGESTGDDDDPPASDGSDGSGDPGDSAEDP